MRLVRTKKPRRRANEKNVNIPAMLCLCRLILEHSLGEIRHSLPCRVVKHKKVNRPETMEVCLGVARALFQERRSKREISPTVLASQLLTTVPYRTGAFKKVAPLARRSRSWTGSHAYGSASLAGSVCRLKRIFKVFIPDNHVKINTFWCTLSFLHSHILCL